MINSPDKYRHAKRNVNRDKPRYVREKRKRKERALDVGIRRSPNPVVARRIGVLRRCSGIVAISSVNPRAPTSNYPLIVPKPSQGAPRLRTIDSHGNEGESPVERSKGRSTGMTRVRRCSGWSRDGDAPSSSNAAAAGTTIHRPRP